MYSQSIKSPLMLNTCTEFQVTTLAEHIYNFRSPLMLNIVTEFQFTPHAEHTHRVSSHPSCWTHSQSFNSPFMPNTFTEFQVTPPSCWMHSQNFKSPLMLNTFTEFQVMPHAFSMRGDLKLCEYGECAHGISPSCCALDLDPQKLPTMWSLWSVINIIRPWDLSMALEDCCYGLWVNMGWCC